MVSDEEIIERAVMKGVRASRSSKRDQSQRTTDGSGLDLQGYHVFDGGDDWQVETINGAGKKWTCPKGLYEVFVKSGSPGYNFYLTSGGAMAALGSESPAGDSWIPSGNSSVVMQWTSAGIAAPNEVLDATGYTNPCMASRGWFLSGGEQISADDILFVVRFRRVG